MRNRMIIGIAALATIGAMAWAVYLQRERSTPYTELFRMYGGSQGVEVVRNPDRVVAYRLATPPEYGERDIGIDKYKVSSGPIDIPAASAKALSRILLSKDSFPRGFSKSCIPAFGVRVVFARENDEVEVNFCFECDLLVVRRNGGITGGANCDPVHAPLADLIRPLFPNDTEIQKI